MIFSDCNKRTQYNSAPWHTRYFRNSKFWWSIYSIYVILSTKILEIFFKSNLQLFSTRALFHHTYFDGPQDHCNCNPKSREIFFWSWEVNFDMIDIEPSLDRSTKISILGLALLESPEALQGFGVLTVAKKTGRRLCQRVMPVVLRLLSRLWYVVKDS